MITNAGSVMVKQEGIFPGLGKVWYYPESISNILSLVHLAKKRRVKFDSGDDNKFKILNENDDTIMEFLQSPNGLYYFDTSNIPITICEREQVSIQ